MMNIEKKIVAIGGGTGLSILLRGLKRVASNITAIVTVADDGGGSGILREDLGMLPPGDIRSNIVALANTEPIMNELLQYRFTDGILKGQNFGNLMIAALVGISGNFEEAIKKINDIFAVTGKVLPVTLDEIHLIAELENGDLVIGESKIPREAKKRNSPISKVYLDKTSASGLTDAITEIENADIIILGPGSLYTSIIPNILIEDIDNAINKSKAKKIFVINMMTQPGETDNFSVRDHVDVFFKHSRYRYIDLVFSNNGFIHEDIISRYREEDSYPILATNEDREYLESIDILLLEADVVEVKKGYLRHDSEKMADIIAQYLELN
ncbi:MAG: gluconeogenesis factor YvcK family protein [Acidaminobacteraceae bacterium]